MYCKSSYVCKFPTNLCACIKAQYAKSHSAILCKYFVCYTGDYGTVHQEPSLLSGLAHKRDQQQQPFHENESHSVFDSTDHNTIQESQNEMEAGEDMQIGPTKLEKRTYLDDNLFSVFTGLCGHYIKYLVYHY